MKEKIVEIFADFDDSFYKEYEKEIERYKGAILKLLIPDHNSYFLHDLGGGELTKTIVPGLYYIFSEASEINTLFAINEEAIKKVNIIKKATDNLIENIKNYEKDQKSIIKNLEEELK